MRPLLPASSCWTPLIPRPAVSVVGQRAGGHGYLVVPAVWSCQRDCARRHPQGSRGYKNLWGSNKPKSLADQHKCPSVRSDDVSSTVGSWRLDWEEEKRFVEWRRDIGEEQTDEERQKVTKEWVRFRDSQGRDRAKLWEDRTTGKSSGFSRGSESWWRSQHYEYEFTGASGVRSMESVQRSLEVLEVTDAGDAPAIRAAYLRLAGKWHPDRYQSAEDKERATEMFRQVSDAYNLLKER